MKKLLLAMFLLPALALAQVYKSVDEYGNVTFTDQPPANAEKVELGETNTSAPPVPGRYPSTPQTPNVPSIKYKVKITSPANDTIIPRGPGNFSVSASVSPDLAPGDQLQLKMDGAPEGAPQRHASWALTNVYRGTHSLQVAVVSAKGKEKGTSQPITVYVFRPSSNF